MLCIFSLLSLKIIIIVSRQNGRKRGREREGEGGMVLSRAAQQFSSNTMNLDGQISKGVLSCSDRQAAYCKHVQANARSCARFPFSSLLNKLQAVWFPHIFTGSQMLLFITRPHLPTVSILVRQISGKISSTCGRNSSTFCSPNVLYCLSC